MNGTLRVIGRPSLAGVTSAGSGASLLPVPAASAFGLWRASVVPAGWAASDGWSNEGTAGSDLDLTVASEAPTLAFTNASTSPGDGNRVTPTLVNGAFVIGLGDGDPPTTTDNVGADYSFFSDAAFDASGSFAWTFDFTPAATGVTFWYLARQGSPFGQDGWHIEEVTGVGGFISYVGDQASFAFTPPFDIDGAGVNTETMVAGRQQYTFVVDRATDVYRCYRNGVALTAEIPDIDDMGDATANLPLVIGPSMTLHNVAYHVGAAAEVLDVATLHGFLGGL